MHVLVSDRWSQHWVVIKMPKRFLHLLQIQLESKEKVSQKQELQLPLSVCKLNSQGYERHVSLILICIPQHFMFVHVLMVTWKLYKKSPKRYLFTLLVFCRANHVAQSCWSHLNVLLVPDICWNGFFFQAAAHTIGFIHVIQKRITCASIKETRTPQRSKQ